MQNLKQCFEKGYNATLKGFIAIGALGLVVAVIKDAKKIED